VAAGGEAGNGALGSLAVEGWARTGARKNTNRRGTTNKTRTIGARERLLCGIRFSFSGHSAEAA
jgi:hypothetical protein